MAFISGAGMAMYLTLNTDNFSTAIDPATPEVLSCSDTFEFAVARPSTYDEAAHIIAEGPFELSASESFGAPLER